MKRRTMINIGVASGAASLLIGLGALGGAAITAGNQSQSEHVAVYQKKTWEANGEELGEAVFVNFVRDVSDTGFSKAQIVEDAQQVCRDFAAGKSGAKMIAEAQAGGDYRIAILTGSVNFYCDEYSEEINE